MGSAEGRGCLCVFLCNAYILYCLTPSQTVQYVRYTNIQYPIYIEIYRFKYTVTFRRHGMGTPRLFGPPASFSKNETEPSSVGSAFFFVWGQFSLLKSDGTLPVALELCDAHIFFPLHIPQHICHLLEFFENYLSSSFASCVFYLPDSFF